MAQDPRYLSSYRAKVIGFAGPEDPGRVLVDVRAFPGLISTWARPWTRVPDPGEGQARAHAAL